MPILLLPSLAPRLGPTVLSRKTEFPQRFTTIETPDGTLVTDKTKLFFGVTPSPHLRKKRGGWAGENYGNAWWIAIQSSVATSCFLIKTLPDQLTPTAWDSGASRSINSAILGTVLS